MPLLPLRGLTVLPGMVLHFDISRERSIKAVETAMSTDQNIFLVTQKNPDHNNPGLRDLYEIGLEAKIRNVAKLPQGIIRVMVEGGERGRLLELDDGGPYLVGETEEIIWEPLELPEATRTAMLRALQELLIQVVNEGTGSALKRDSYQAAGKTGSAEFETGKETHAWFVGYAPAEDPKIAVCVIVEEGGSGGGTAAPIAAELMDAWLLGE